MLNGIQDRVHSYRLYRRRERMRRRYMAWRASELGLSTKDYEKLVKSVKQGMR